MLEVVADNKQEKRQRFHAFISYSRKDRPTAERLYNDLRLQGLDIFMDDQIAPGESIEEKVTDALQQSQFTICMVSKNSLLSPWVAEETLLRLAIDKVDSSQSFIPCHLDQEFLSNNCHSIVEAKISGQIIELDDLRDQRGLQGTEDLDIQRQRLVLLKNNLSQILTLLREHHSECISEPSYTVGLREIFRRITNKTQLIVEPSSRINIDIRSRQREIEDLFARSDLQNATKRLMDYVREFVPHRLRDAIGISQKINFILAPQEDITGKDKLEEVAAIVMEALELMALDAMVA